MNEEIIIRNHILPMCIQVPDCFRTWRKQVMWSDFESTPNLSLFSRGLLSPGPAHWIRGKGIPLCYEIVLGFLGDGTGRTLHVRGPGKGGRCPAASGGGGGGADTVAKFLVLACCSVSRPFEWGIWEGRDIKYSFFGALVSNRDNRVGAKRKGLVRRIKVSISTMNDYFSLTA